MDAIIDADNLAGSLIEAGLFEEALSLLRDMIPRSRRTLGDEHKFTLDFRSRYACAISQDTNSSCDDVHEAVAILEDVVRTSRRVFGLQHPFFANYREDLENARMRLMYDLENECNITTNWLTNAERVAPSAT